MHFLVILYICECMYSSKCCKPVYSSEHVIFPIMFDCVCIFMYIPVMIEFFIFVYTYI